MGRGEARAQGGVAVAGEQNKNSAQGTLGRDVSAGRHRCGVADLVHTVVDPLTAEVKPV